MSAAHQRKNTVMNMDDLSATSGEARKRVLDASLSNSEALSDPFHSTQEGDSLEKFLQAGAVADRARAQFRADHLALYIPEMVRWEEERESKPSFVIMVPRSNGSPVPMRAVAFMLAERFPGISLAFCAERWETVQFPPQVPVSAERSVLPAHSYMYAAALLPYGAVLEESCKAFDVLLWDESAGSRADAAILWDASSGAVTVSRRDGSVSSLMSAYDPYPTSGHRGRIHYPGMSMVFPEYNLTSSNEALADWLYQALGLNELKGTEPLPFVKARNDVLTLPALKVKETALVWEETVLGLLGCENGESGDPSRLILSLRTLLPSAPVKEIFLSLLEDACSISEVPALIVTARSLADG